jgi:hypothetical protein
MVFAGIFSHHCLTAASEAYAPNAAQGQWNFTHQMHLHFCAARVADVVHL